MKDSLSKNADYGDGGGGSSTILRAPAHHDRKTRWRQARAADSQ